MTRCGKLTFLGLLAFLLTLLPSPLIIAKERSCLELFKKALTSTPIGLPYRKLMYGQGETLASYPRVEIESFVRNSRDYKWIAQDLAKKMRTFDQHMADLGFQIPESTRIVLLRPGLIQKLLTKPLGGYFLPNLVWHRRKGVQSVIGINFVKTGNTIFYDILGNTDLFLHERAHSILSHSYNRYALVNSFQELHLQEALADFFATHELGIPRYFKRARDIESKRFHHLDRTQLKRNFGTEQYVDSIHYANALWQVRQAFSNTTFSSLMKNFVDNLNFYRDSFRILKGWGTKKIKYEKRAIDELEFFLAVLKRTVAKTRNEEDALKVDQIVAKIADELGLDSNRIDDVSQKIVKSESDISYDFTTDMKIGRISKYVIHAHLFYGYFLLGPSLVVMPISLMGIIAESLHSLYKDMTSDDDGDIQ